MDSGGEAGDLASLGSGEGPPRFHLSAFRRGGGALLSQLRPSPSLRGLVWFPPPTPTEQLCLAAVGLPWAPLGSRKGWKKGCGEQGRASHLPEGLEQLLQPGNLVLQRRAWSLPSPHPCSTAPSHGRGPSRGPAPSE